MGRAPPRQLSVENIASQPHFPFFKENGNHTILKYSILHFAIMMRVILSLFMLLSAAVAFVPGATRPSFAPTRLFMSDEMKKGTVKWCVPSGFLPK